MKVADLALEEYSTEDEDEAEILAILSDKIPVHDRLEDEYRILDQENLRSRVKELYEEDRYLDAEELMDSYDRFSSLNPEKEIEEIKTKSFRFSFENFIRAVEHAYQEEMSISDLIRYNISSELKSRIDELYDNPEIDDEIAEFIEDVIENWSEKKGRSPLADGYTLNWDVKYLEDREKYNNFARYHAGKNFLEDLFEEMSENEGEEFDFEELIDIFLKHFKNFEPDIMFDDSRLKLIGRNGELSLNFSFATYYSFRPHEEPDEFLLDLANSGYSNEELEQIFEWFANGPHSHIPYISEIAEKVIEIREEQKDSIESAEDRENIDTSIFEFGHRFVELQWGVELRRPLTVDDEVLKWGGVPVEEGKIQELVLDKFLDDELKNLDVEKAKQRVDECLEEGDIETAREINHRVSIYDSTKYVAEIIEDIVLDGVSSPSQVVSLSIPKGVLGLVNLFDLDRDDMIG